MTMSRKSTENGDSSEMGHKRKHSEVPPDEEDLISDDEGGLHIDDIYIPPPCEPACSLETTGPRLIIAEIRNYFFKSYAGEVILGPFCKTFNSIVGPNGTGKSNVIDSILFVFGYRATKIRCKKLSVLIHNSERYQNVPSCSVTIKFVEIIDGEGDNYEIVPNSEFSITRTANKDNSSYYMIDDRKVQFREVAKLLKGHGIDMEHNRFLILQGQVEQIAMMKCKGENEHENGLLEYFEDIIGTSRYIKPLEMLAEKVDQFSARRVEKLSMLKVVKDVVDELYEPMQRAVKYLKIENQMVTLQNTLYQRNIHDLCIKMKSNEEEVEKVKEMQNEFVEQLNQLKEKRKEKENELKKDSQKYASLRERKETLQTAFDVASKKDMQLQESLKALSKSKKKTQQQLLEQNKLIEQYEDVPEKSKADIAELEIKKQELSEKKLKLERERDKKIATINEETKDLQKEKEELLADLVVLKKTVDQSKGDYTLAESQLKMFLRNEETEKEKYNQLMAQHENCKKTITEHTATLSELKRKIPSTTQTLNNAIKELNELRPKEEEVLKYLRSKRMSLEEKKSSMQASKSRGRVLDSLMQQKREGKCPGLYGRLGDLGGIDAKYDIAISTACGQLDFIVVDTIDTATWCLNFLKVNDIGRATFIALEKQEHLRGKCQTAIRTPENVPRLFDLIKVQDEDVKTAFYYALRDTLVANNLEQATRVAYGAQRYRVVTLQGQMIEQTGQMSGGGRPLRGRMGQSVQQTHIDPKMLTKLAEEVEEMEQKKVKYSNRKMELDEQISDLQTNLRKMKLDCDKFEVELRGLEKQCPRIEMQLKEQRLKVNETKSDPKEREKLEKIVTLKKKLFDEASKTIEDLDKKVEKLTDEIDAKGAGQIKIIQNQLTEIVKKLNKIDNEILKLNVSVKTAENNTVKANQKIEQMERNLEEMKEQMGKIAEQRKEIEEDASKLLVCLDEMKTTLEEVELTYTEMKECITMLTEKENKLKLEKVDLEQKLKNAQKNVNGCKSSINGWKMKLGKLKLQEIPDEVPESLKEFSEEEIEKIDVQETEEQLKKTEGMLSSLKPNLTAIDEYNVQKKVFIERTKEVDEISTKLNDMKKVFNDVKQRRKDEFMNGYNIIKIKFKEMYQMITLEGDADVDLVDSFDPFSEGIQLHVRPPRKTWKKISNLSGGEKTLTSLALVFALHYYKPSPLYVMDEIDAALDFKNVSIIGHYIKERTKNAQFLIITLRQEMFELADLFIGIYKTANCSKTITIQPE